MKSEVEVLLVSRAWRRPSVVGVDGGELCLLTISEAASLQHENPRDTGFHFLHFSEYSSRAGPPRSSLAHSHSARLHTDRTLL